MNNWLLTGVFVALIIMGFKGHDPKNINTMETFEKTTLGGGCFWCVEAVFEKLDGIEDAVSGYSGGHIKNPAYREVTTGNTGHAEVVQLTFDKNKISFEEILEVFFKTHDPTTLNRQGNDVGTQYRSVIYYHNNEQRETAEKYIQYLEGQGIYKNPVVTEVKPIDQFYRAEDYHQDYFAKNPNQPYCAFVVAPKVKKVEHLFQDMLK